MTACEGNPEPNTGDGGLQQLRSFEGGVRGKKRGRLEGLGGLVGLWGQNSEIVKWAACNFGGRICEWPTNFLDINLKIELRVVRVILNLQLLLIGISD